MRGPSNDDNGDWRLIGHPALWVNNGAKSYLKCGILTKMEDMRNASPDLQHG